MDVSLADGEKMAELIFYRMSKDPAKPGQTGYDMQDLELSKYFSKWPSSLTKKNDGSVQPEGN